MRKTVRFLLLGGLLAMTAADPAAAQMAIGGLVGAGTGTADISVADRSINPGSRTVWNAGGVMYVGLKPYFGIQGGAVYSQKGPDSILVDTTVTRFSVNYVNIPLMAVGMFPASGMFKLRALAGPSFNLKVGCGSAAEGEPVLDCDQDAVKNFEWSLVFGGGLKVGNGVGGLTLDVMYDLGLTNINNTDQNISFKNRTVSLNIGFLLQFPELTPPQRR
jgi:Outer membrane protein beta-barrel domain